MPESKNKGSNPTERARYQILIADDSEINRALLSAILEDEYDITEVENGAQAVALLRDHAQEFALVLLDVVMPEMDGFEVLMYMNKYHWIDDLPVIMISSETAPQFIRRAYEFHASDYINRPFDAAIVRRRVENTLMLYAKQRRLVGMVADQMYEKEKASSIMVSILSHIVEFRNGESGLHVLHISTITELLLRGLQLRTDQYPLSTEEISLISTASALHDIGKISIPSEVLNKPGRLTEEEFALIKTHSAVGADMIAQLPMYQDEPLIQYAYQIARWHHERYDGRGYPDGLVGEEIPISAQIVALADVYDALTSERCYKKAFSHEKAIEMIIGGECGSFNPLMLELLRDMSEEIRESVSHASVSAPARAQVSKVTEQLLKQESVTGPERLANQLALERAKYQFLCTAVDGIVFLYTRQPPILTLNPQGAARLGMKETIIDPIATLQLKQVANNSAFSRLTREARAAAPASPETELECDIMLDGKPTRCRCRLGTLWTEEDSPDFLGVIGVINEMKP